MLLVAITFLAIFFVVLLCVGLALAYFETKQRRQVRRMLHTAEDTTDPFARAVLVRSNNEGESLPRWLARLPLFVKLNAVIEQSHTGWTPGKFLVMSAAGAVIGGFVSLRLHFFPTRLVGILLVGGIGASLPLLMLLRKRAKSLSAFEEQFPEALDFLSRSMRAGHGFTISLEILGKDAPEPLAAALRRVSHEMQLGSSLNVALEKMTLLVPLVDVRFFVSSVLLQQETGGNLSEILTKLSYVIRERFRLRGQVKALSAHGRITGLVLLLMPLAVTGILLATNPDYLQTLTNDKDGRLMLYGAVAGQIVAYFIIKKIVNIKV